MTTTHTPGPWLIERSMGGLVGPHWLISSKDDYVGHFYDEGHSQGGESNARLIAAAPDLLAALEGMLSLDRHADAINVKVARKIARAAIAKARGEG